MMSSTQPNTNSPEVNFDLILETHPSSQLPDFFAQHPEVVHRRFWHGLTTLHKICLRLDSTVECVLALIRAGADVNAVNNFGETCLMFAAKKGSIKFCQILLQHGADITTTDQAGRSVIHHSVLGGSIHMTHYIHILYKISLNESDSRGQTCLHIACSQGAESMVRYLLRADRCDPHKADEFGNTSLHTAAQYGHERVVYRLLHSAGLSLVDKRNVKNLSASEVCDGRTTRHKQTLELLNFAYQQKYRGYHYLHSPRPLLLWYALMPAAIFLSGVTAAKLLNLIFKWYFSWITVYVTLGYVLYLFIVHDHRIKHFTRAANPMHAGAFGSGLIGTFLVWLILVIPASDLTDGWTLLLIVSGLVLAVPVFYLYISLLTKDPGFIPASNVTGSNGTAALRVALESSDSTSRFCIDCDVVTSGNVKHCKLCDRCVVHMDHHCLFLMTCVATLNHLKFVVFIMLVVMSIVVFLLSSYNLLSLRYSKMRDVTIAAVSTEEELTSDMVWSSSLFSENILLTAVMVLNLSSLVWGLSLIYWNLRYISSGLTYYESLHSQPSKNRPLSVKDRLYNLIWFFRGRKTPYKTPGVYSI